MSRTVRPGSLAPPRSGSWQIHTTASSGAGSRAIWAWSLYDFANSAFTTLVITFIYATFFVKGIAPDETTGAVLWAWAVVAPTAVAVALLSPLLGALADRTGTRKRALAVSTVVTVVGTALLFFPQRGDVWQAVVLVVVANIAFEVGQVFYNAFLPEIAPPDKIGRVSGWGWALGYLGGLLCMALALAWSCPTCAPFGLDKATGEHVRVTNLLVAGWFALFSLPAFLVLREPRAEGGAAAAACSGPRSASSARRSARSASTARSCACSSRACSTTTGS